MKSISAPTVCANCGKGERESNNLKSCAACKLVKYCSRGCQAAHRPQHKKACKKKASELYDEKLFKDPPPPEECPICFQPHPLDTAKSAFKSCCGKQICGGCLVGLKESEGGAEICPFCRTPIECSEEEENKRVKKLTDCNHPYAFNYLATAYDNGDRGFSQNCEKANELWLKGGDHNLGNAYYYGRGVEVDKKKAQHYYELAAMMGCVDSRFYAGNYEGQIGNVTGNHERAFKHYIIAAKAGCNESLDKAKQGFMHV